ncbi:dTDP-4-dehydrorhamnose 3,5-epimerase [Pararhodonellum marinum]|uniref:dTDP-4-dehydrorhamnose 3,5-epimerase n=1 Tax=Pararhodonellum marinum TaxID=2755358 RepID=UPI00188F9112|nr:dTDP-4-dehydrorhamnose 3,5-epimerase [Pararhodonellum marinum]
MIFHKTKISDLFTIELDKKEDDRGFFARIFCEEIFANHNIDFKVVQSNMSFSKKKGTMRGLHYQKSPYEEAKLVKCIHGSIFDVVIDLRPESPTYLQWVGTELTEHNHKLLYIPPLCAHGFLTLAPNSKVTYMVSAPYAPNHEGAIRYNDPLFNINWPTEIESITERDQKIPDFITVNKK